MRNALKSRSTGTSGKATSTSGKGAPRARFTPATPTQSCCFMEAIFSQETSKSSPSMAADGVANGCQGPLNRLRNALGSPQEWFDGYLALLADSTTTAGGIQRHLTRLAEIDARAEAQQAAACAPPSQDAVAEDDLNAWLMRALSNAKRVDANAMERRDTLRPVSEGGWEPSDEEEEDQQPGGTSENGSTHSYEVYNNRRLSAEYGGRPPPGAPPLARCGAGGFGERPLREEDEDSDKTSASESSGDEAEASAQSFMGEKFGTDKVMEAFRKEMRAKGAMRRKPAHRAATAAITGAIANGAATMMASASAVPTGPAAPVATGIEAGGASPGTPKLANGAPLLQKLTSSPAAMPAAAASAMSMLGSDMSSSYMAVGSFHVPPALRLQRHASSSGGGQPGQPNLRRSHQIDASSPHYSRGGGGGAPSPSHASFAPRMGSHAFRAPSLRQQGSNNSASSAGGGYGASGMAPSTTLRLLRADSFRSHQQTAHAHNHTAPLASLPEGTQPPHSLHRMGAAAWRCGSGLAGALPSAQGSRNASFAALSRSVAASMRMASSRLGEAASMAGLMSIGSLGGASLPNSSLGRLPGAPSTASRASTLPQVLSDDDEDGGTP